MRNFHDVYNVGNDYPQYMIIRKKPKPVPPLETETDIELLFGDDKLIIRLDDLSKKEISKVEANLIQKD